MMKFCADQGIAVIPWSPLARGYLAGSGLGEGAATVRGRTDAYTRALGLGSRQDEAIRRRVGEVARQIRRQAGDRGAGLGSVQALRHRADRRRLQAASSRRRGRGAVAEARREAPSPGSRSLIIPRRWSGTCEADALFAGAIRLARKPRRPPRECVSAFRSADRRRLRRVPRRRHSPKARRSPGMPTARAPSASCRRSPIMTMRCVAPMRSRPKR